MSAKVEGTPAKPVTSCSAIDASTTFGKADAVLDDQRPADGDVCVQQRQSVDVTEGQHAHDAVGCGQVQVGQD